MAVIRVAALCVAGAMICTVLRAQRPEMALACALCAGLCALYLCLEPLREAMNALQTLSGGAEVSGEAAQLLVRGTGISLLTDFAAQLCRDAGEASLSGRVELAGRVTILSLCAPMLLRVTQSLCALLP